MILLSILLTQSDPQDPTPRVVAFCSSAANDQPERFCLADRKHERAERKLATALAAARRAALAQKREIAAFSRANGGVTLAGDPLQALDRAQRAWTRSYQADCAVLGLARATGNGGTEGVTANSECEATSILDRVRFLADAYR